MSYIQFFNFSFIRKILHRGLNLKKSILLVILICSLGTQAVSNTPLTDTDLKKAVKNLKTTLKSLGITITDSQIDQKMQEISQQIAQQDSKNLNQPIQNTPLSKEEIQKILKTYGISQEDLHQLTQQIQSFNP